MSYQLSIKVSLAALSLGLMALAAPLSNAQDKKELKDLPIADPLPTAKSNDLLYDPETIIGDLTTKGPLGTKSNEGIGEGNYKTAPSLTDALKKAENSLFPPTLSMGKSTAPDMLDIEIEETTDTPSGLGDEPTSSTTKAIYGQDDRIELSTNRNTTDARIGQLIIGDPFKSYSNCSGSLISPTHVITAAHCVINSKTNSFVEGPIGFAPGRVESHDPYGIYYAKRVFILRAYQNMRSGKPGMATREMSAADLAVVELNNSPVNGNLGYLAYKSFDFQVNKVSLTGYPADKANGSKWTTDCSYVNDNTFLNGLVVGTFCDAFQGMSGGPLLEQGTNGDKKIVAVLSAGPDGPQIEGNRNRALLFAHLKSGNAFRWANPQNMWVSSDIGSIDWPTVWSNYSRLNQLLPATMTDVQKNNLVNAFKSLTIVHNVPQQNKYNYIDIRNNCFKDIQMAIGIMHEGQRKFLGFLNVKYNQKIQIPNAGKSYYYWASSVDGSSTWKGENMVTFRGYNLGMRFKNPSSNSQWARSRIKLDCTT